MSRRSTEELAIDLVLVFIYTLVVLCAGFLIAGTVLFIRGDFR